MIRRVSLKRQRQLALEKELIARLLTRCGGLCDRCGPDWRGLSKHEKRFRSQGGDPLAPENCVMLCGRCHAAIHGVTER